MITVPTTKLHVYFLFFIFVVAYSTYTVLSTTYGFIETDTFTIDTFIIRMIALAMIYIMFFMFVDIVRTKKDI